MRCEPFIQSRSAQHAHLVSSKQLTCFSDFRLSFAHSDHLTLDVRIYLLFTLTWTAYRRYCQEYVRYLESYAHQFNLYNRIYLNSKVVKIERSSSKKHVVSYVRRTSTNLKGVPEWESSASATT